MAQGRSTQIISMIVISWIRTIRLSIKNALSLFREGREPASG